MKNVLKLEEAMMFVFSIYLFSLLHFPGWLFAALLLTPDLGALGYLGGNKSGAFFYNIFHHKGVAIAIYLLGIYLQNEKIQLAGIILFGHSSMDRVFGYGLKYVTGFQFTHLGQIGRQANHKPL